MLAAAASAIERDGVAALSLRALARDLGVTHAAPRHHFGDKRGVLTALASQGYRELAAAARAAADQGGLLDSGVAYVDFSRRRPAHFSVMFRTDLVNDQDPELRAALDDLYAALAAAVRQAGSAGIDAQRPPTGPEGDLHTGPESPGERSVALAAWCLAHGFATLARAGNFTLEPGQDEADLARRTLRHLDTGNTTDGS